jgi:phenylacetate-CoA ligase
MPSTLDKIYSHSPTWLQQLGVNLYGIIWRNRRYGGVFEDAVCAYMARESLTTDEWHSYQTQQLRRLLVYAEQHVPYYRTLFHDLDLRSGDLEQFRLEDLPSLPLLNKESLRQAPSEFLADNISKKSLHTYLTSGTSGTPLGVMFTSEMHQRMYAAFEARARRWAGVDHKMSRAMIGGRLVVPRASSKPPFWRYNAVERQLYMSAFHISPANVPYYVEALNHYKPDYLMGYASGHFFLARMIKELGLNVHSPRAVLTSSEKLFPEMRAVLEEVYHSPVFDGYSGVEACCLATECEHHHLHLSPDVGIVEILDDSGMPVQVGQSGEITATGLLNFAQPLIRYRTGDYAVLSDQSCPCGRQMSVIRELVGRIEDTVVGPDGRETVRFHGIFVGLQGVREGQIVQETLYSFRVRLAVDSSFDESECGIIRRRFAERLGPVNVAIEYVDEIERTERGKFRAVISKVQRIPAGPHAE